MSFIYNGLAQLGLTIAKLEYLAVCTTIDALLHPIQAFTTVKDLALSVINDPGSKDEGYLELGDKNKLLRVKVKTLSKVEQAFNEWLKKVDWSQWKGYKKVYLSIQDLTKYEPSYDSHHIRHCSNIEEFIEKTRINVNFVQSIVAHLTNHSFKENHFKLIRKIQRLKSPNEIVSYSETCGKNKWKILISGDRSVYIQSQQIGVGSSKVVYSGENLFSTEKVALLKVDTQTEEKRINHEHELEILKALKNVEGVVSVKGDYTTQNHNKIIIAELCEENSLKSHLGRHTRAEKVDIALQILKILMSIHKEEIIYSDLKPENLYLKRAPENRRLLVRFGDFNMSYKMGDKPLGGSIYNMSPEHLNWMMKLDENDQHLDKTIQLKSEIFEIGLVLLELLLVDSYQEQPFPWCEKIDELFNARNIEDLKTRYQELKSIIIKKLTKLGVEIESLDNNVEANVYRMILAMLNVEYPDHRPHLDEVIQVFENYAQFLEQTPSINHVPAEIIKEIFKFLPYKELTSARRVCKKWNILAGGRNRSKSVQKWKCRLDLSKIWNWKPKAKSQPFIVKELSRRSRIYISFS